MSAKVSCSSRRVTVEGQLGGHSERRSDVYSCHSNLFKAHLCYPCPGGAARKHELYNYSSEPLVQVKVEFLCWKTVKEFDLGESEDSGSPLDSSSWCLSTAGVRPLSPSSLRPWSLLPFVVLAVFIQGSSFLTFQLSRHKLETS